MSMKLKTASGSITLAPEDGSGDVSVTIPRAGVTPTTSASDLTSGTLADARFPATLPAISGANLTNLPASGATTLDGLTDVDTSTAAPTDGQVLAWDNTASKWEPATAGGGGGGGWTTITTGTVTGTATYNLDFTNIPASYNDLRLTIIEGESISSGLSWRYFRMLVGTDSTFATTRTYRSNSVNNIRGAGLTTETNNSYSTSDYGGGGIHMTLIGNGVTKYSAGKIYGSIDFVNVNSDFHYVDSSFNAIDSTEIVTHRARSAGWSGGLNNLRFYTGYNTGFIAGTQFLLQGK